MLCSQENLWGQGTTQGGSALCSALICEVLGPGVGTGLWPEHQESLFGGGACWWLLVSEPRA